MTSGQPLQYSDLIFSAQNASINHFLGDLKRSNLSIGNRLRSIQYDAGFVESVADAYQLPIVANERCGSWYVSSGRKQGSAYFKSTDGHTGQWAFSLRRLNLQVLEVVQAYGGYIDYFDARSTLTTNQRQMYHCGLYTPWQKHARRPVQDCANVDCRLESITIP